MVKNMPANAGDVDSIPGLGRSPGGGNGNPLQYSCLENPMDRGVWQATAHSVSKGWTRLSNQTRTPPVGRTRVWDEKEHSQSHLWELPSSICWLMCHPTAIPEQLKYFFWLMSWILSECCSCETPGSDRDCDDVADDHLMSLGTVIVS